MPVQITPCSVSVNPDPVREGPKTVTVTVQVPEELIGAVAGTDSCNFRQLEKGYRVSITYSTSANEGHDQLSNEVVVSSNCWHTRQCFRLTDRGEGGN